MSKATEKKEDVTIDVKSMNIFQRVAAITEELGVVAKNLNVSAGKGSYKAVSERDIIDAVKPLEAKYRVYSYPSHRTILESETLETEKTYNGSTTKSTTFFTRVQTEYTFVNIDNPEDKFITIVFSEGIDPGDKGSGKAMTYADKYAVMKAYKISTGDDPDQEASEPAKYTRTGNGYKNAPAPKPAPTPAPTNAPIHKCGNCGKPITDVARRDGTVMTAADVAYFSIQQFGVAYCADCQRELARIRGQK